LAAAWALPGCSKFSDLACGMGHLQAHCLLPRESASFVVKGLYQGAMILTHEDGYWRFSARSARSGDVVHRHECATLPEGRQYPPSVAISRPLAFVAASPR
jgi:hypothetical protein